MNLSKRFITFICLAVTIVLNNGLSFAEKVRPSVLAGSWYSADSAFLRNQITSFLSDANPVELPAQSFYGLIVPHAGLRFSGPTGAWAYKVVEKEQFKRVMILAPSHHIPFRGASIPDVDFYETPFGRIPLDSDMCAMLKKHDLIHTVPSAHSAEHAIEIQLPFVQHLFPNAMLVPVLIGELVDGDYYALAAVLKQAVDGQTLVIVSSDFTHYGKRFSYIPFTSAIEKKIRELDDGAIKQIVNKNFLGFQKYRKETEITICGGNPIAVFLNMIPESVYVEQLAYMTSGRLTGDFSNSVSYVAVVFYEPLKQESTDRESAKQ
ncbi:AmmeMemoRadiSam system protein B [bacterium]|nr:AmmeMemoRadiSam system protein B [bacterium]